MKTTTAFAKICKAKHKNKIIQGSQGASKTFSILQRWIILAALDYCSDHCSIISDTLPNLKTGAIKDFESICNNENIEVKKTKSPYVFKIKRWTFEFFSVDKENKGLGGRRDRLFINEGNRLAWKICRQLIARTHKEVIVDFNPAAEFWAHTEYVNTGDCAFLKLTYKDNEYLPQSEIDSIERYAPWGLSPDANYWRVYGLGELGFTEGQIFTNVEEFDLLPEGEYQESIGVDFGWYPDPLTAVKVWVDHDRESIFWKELVYSTKMKYETFAPEIQMSESFNEDTLVCDHAPRDIRTLRRLGFNAVSANKKKGVVGDIRTIKQYKLHVHKDSTNLKRELDNWVYQEKKTNGSERSYIEYPLQSCEDHAIDAARYGTTYIIRN